MDGANFLSWGQHGGKQKDTGGKRPEPAQVSVNTLVRPTQNIRFNEYLPHFLSFNPFLP